MRIKHLDNDQTQWSLNGNGLQGTFNGELTTSAKLFGGKRAGRFKLAEKCNLRTLCTTKVRTYVMMMTVQTTMMIVMKMVMVKVMMAMMEVMMVVMMMTLDDHNFCYLCVRMFQFLMLLIFMASVEHGKP